MYRNLEAELARAGITKKQLADFLQVKPSTICEKLSKPSRLKLCEAKAIRTRFFPSLTMEYLFEEAA